MRLLHALLLGLMPILTIGQSHSIDQHELYMSGTVDDVSAAIITWHATIDAVSGLDIEQTAGVQAFPIPCMGQLQLEGIPAGAKVLLQDQAGAIVRKLSATSAQHTVINNLTPGVYILTTTLEGLIVDRRRILSL